MNTKNKRVISWFYKSHSGELHVGLPILKLIKDHNPEIEINFIFPDKISFENIGNIYNKIILELGNVVTGTKEFYFFLMKNLNNTTMIMTCDTGHTFFSSIASNVIKKNKVLFHMHAYALHGTNNLEDFLEEFLKDTLKKRYLNDGKGSPYIILNSNHEVDYYYEVGCFNKEHMILAGGLGYTNWWLTYLKDNSSSSSEYLRIKKLIKNGKYNNVYFVPIRQEHKLCLTKENYDYLIESIFWLAEKNSDSVFLLKPHPRQTDISDLSERCNSAVNNNIILINESTLLLSDVSDLTISFWSSAIQDSLAVGTLAVEFFRHHIEHPQLVKTDSGDLISLYVAYGFCPFFTKKEELHNFLTTKHKWDKLFKNSIKNFKPFFPTDHKIQTQFLLRVDDLFDEADCVSSKSNASFFSILFQILRINLIAVFDIFGIKNKVIKTLKKS